MKILVIMNFINVKDSSNFKANIIVIQNLLEYGFCVFVQSYVGKKIFI
jgi:hypothetical protein